MYDPSLLVTVDDVVPAAAIARTDHVRDVLGSTIGGFSASAVADLVSSAEYGGDRTVTIATKDSPVRTQDSPQCSAFATVAAMENVLGGKTDLSERSLWNLYQTYSTERAIECAHEGWISYASGSGAAQIAVFESLDDDFRRLAAAIDAGTPCVVALSVPTQLAHGAVQVEDDSPMEMHGLFHKKLAGHAMEVSGYKIERGRPYFQVKNSWGVGNGDRGYQWVSYHLFKLRGYVYFWSIVRLDRR